MTRHRKKSQKKKLKQIWPLLLIGAGLLILGAAALIMLPKPAVDIGEDGPSAIPVAVNYTAPSLTLTDLDGNPVSLADFVGEKIVLVNNWATWCPPCKAEMPTLQAYYDDHQRQDFIIVAIESGEPVNQVEDFAESYGLTFAVWPDPAQQATQAFRNPGLPSSYVIDRTGTVRLAWTGAISRKMLDEYVTPLLED